MAHRSNTNSSCFKRSFSNCLTQARIWDPISTNLALASRSLQNRQPWQPWIQSYVGECKIHVWLTANKIWHCLVDCKQDLTLCGWLQIHVTSGFESGFPLGNLVSAKYNSKRQLTWLAVNLERDRELHFYSLIARLNQSRGFPSNSTPAGEFDPLDRALYNLPAQQKLSSLKFSPFWSSVGDSTCKRDRDQRQ